jgi:hypothetical protein
MIGAQRIFLEDLVKVLRGEGENGAQGEKLKALITTTRKSRTLVKVLEPNELLLADGNGAVNSPARRGGRSNLTL